MTVDEIVTMKREVVLKLARDQGWDVFDVEELATLIRAAFEYLTIRMTEEREKG
jgi:hypothetical protein